MLNIFEPWTFLLHERISTTNGFLLEHSYYMNEIHIWTVFVLEQFWKMNALPPWFFFWKMNGLPRWNGSAQKWLPLCGASYASGYKRRIGIFAQKKNLTLGRGESGISAARVVDWEEEVGMFWPAPPHGMDGRTTPKQAELRVLFCSPLKRSSGLPGRVLLFHALSAR
jgi:hypothetical protein